MSRWRYYGEPHHFDFEPKHHVDLCTDLGLIDYERGTRLAGSGFWIYRGMARASSGPCSTTSSTST